MCRVGVKPYTHTHYQKLKQFADIVYTFLLQKQSKFETVGLTDSLILDHAVLKSILTCSRFYWWGSSDILRA